MKKENQDRKSGPNRFGPVRFCGFNRSLGPDFQALIWMGILEFLTVRCFADRTPIAKSDNVKKKGGHCIHNDFISPDLSRPPPTSCQANPVAS
jgi:hypothetical protein